MDNKQLSHIVKKFNIRLGPMSINDDTIDVYGNVKICHTNLRKIPLRFRNVYGDFICSSNQLTTLKNCPQYVAGDFNCYGNKLTNLKYCPEEVDGNFSCHQNLIISLKGSPKIINGNFSCFLNNLTTLIGGPISVNGNYFAFQNNLTSLKGSPDFVYGIYNVAKNKMISNLIGCPKIIGTFLFDDTVSSLYMGDKSCEVERVEIKKKKNTLYSGEKTIEQVVITHQKYLKTVFKYIRLLDIWDKKGNFDESNFIDVILDIEEGLR